VLEQKRLMGMEHAKFSFGGMTLSLPTQLVYLVAKWELLMLASLMSQMSGLKKNLQVWQKVDASVSYSFL
jgi:hypothetical protein